MNSFLSASKFAVVGASASRDKFGNKVLRWYKDRKCDVVPINPRESEIEGLAVVASLDALASTAGFDPSLFSVSVITPPSITRSVLEAGVAKGFKRFWLQPGAEFPGWQTFGEEHSVLVIGGGPCVLRDAKL
ncbi:CoA-binding domain protein [Catenaria anguillulae PL171]|uniref:CoA-binding domain protein n=1 Tax=Catenaria anguillulae PL171 TaxID=765915 RepID=A0A1Y2HJ39_9FUNG|nr:CoA-binding domain protein [Catenaria anguillulae PL171]